MHVPCLPLYENSQILQTISETIAAQFDTLDSGSGENEPTLSAVAGPADCCLIPRNFLPQLEENIRCAS
jgi:hypothetical protein